MKTRQIMPPTCLLISITFMIILHLALPGTMIIPQPWNLLGVIMLALGVAINIIADRTLHETNTTVKPFEESSALVIGGVFRISRNPMYLGFILILIGIAILLGSITPYTVIFAFAILMEKVFISVEERVLAAKFGTQWTAYAKSTRRWL